MTSHPTALGTSAPRRTATRQSGDDLRTPLCGGACAGVVDDQEEVGDRSQEGTGEIERSHVSDFRIMRVALADALVMIDSSLQFNEISLRSRGKAPRAEGF